MADAGLSTGHGSGEIKGLRACVPPAHLMVSAIGAGYGNGRAFGPLKSWRQVVIFGICAGHLAFDIAGSTICLRRRDKAAVMSIQSLAQMGNAVMPGRCLQNLWRICNGDVCDGVEGRGGISRVPRFDREDLGLPAAR